MPSAFVTRLARKHGKSPAEGERIWNAATAAAKQSGQDEASPRFYGTVTSLFKKMVSKEALGDSPRKFQPSSDEPLTVDVDFGMVKAESRTLGKFTLRLGQAQAVLRFLEADEPTIRRLLRNRDRFKLKASSSRLQIVKESLAKVHMLSDTRPTQDMMAFILDY